MELCPNCFEQSYQNAVCSRCGYQFYQDKPRGQKALPIGTILKQRYYLGKLLGEGGFGITYKAYDLKSKEICCVKEYVPNGLCRRRENDYKLELSSYEAEIPYRAGLRRFLEEAQILSKLEQIPSVVYITDIFQEYNTAYFVMEYLDGADLRQIVKASPGRLSVEMVTNVILQVALSMDVIHTKTKIIHRDISPENIYITRNGKVKVIDFGSAKQTETGAKDGLSVVLKPKFAPPEQFSSQMMQGAFTDVYSLAGTYYYALTGKNIPSAMDRLSGQEYVSLKYMNIGVNDALSDAVDRALILNVNRRTGTMQQFLAEIAEAVQVKTASELQQQEQLQIVEQRQREQQNRKANQRHQVVIPYALVVEGVERGRTWIITPNQTLKFGRSETEANLRVAQPENVSRVHCLITYLAEYDRFCIRDVSYNGVFYKGQRLKKGTDYNVKPPARFVMASNACVIELGVKHEYR